MRGARQTSEQDFQKAVAQFLNVALPADVWWSSLDHAGGGATVGAFRKARGVRKGLPDILLVHEGRALWIELKAERGRVSTAQAKTHGDLWEAGSPVAICRSLSEVQMVLLRWSIPLKARAA